MIAASSPETLAQLAAYDEAAQARPWEYLTGLRPTSVSDDEVTALSLFRAARGPAHALTYFDRKLDYTTLDELSDRLAAWWHAKGIGRGDRVAIVLQNTPIFIIAVVAAWKLSARIRVGPWWRRFRRYPRR